MDQSPTRIPLTSPLQDRPALTGAACCLVSALAYTAADICLRQLSRLGSDPVWTVCNKELVTVLIVGPWLLNGEPYGIGQWIVLLGFALQLWAAVKQSRLLSRRGDA
jgi:drug/metabolite transporter (DMT)-like permease